jgi:hypothetical protein
MHSFDELARLLAAPSVMDPEPRHEGEDEERKKEPAQDPNRQRESHHVDEFEDIEVGDPRDGP